MSVKSAVGSVLGSALLVVGAGAALCGVGLVGVSVIVGPTAPRLFGVMVAFGFALTAGFTGYFLRKAAAGQVLPVDFDRSVAFWGGGGGL